MYQFHQLCRWIVSNNTIKEKYARIGQVLWRDLRSQDMLSVEGDEIRGG